MKEDFFITNGLDMKLQQILKDSNYKLTQFSQAMIEDLENRIIEKDSKGKVTYKVMCLIRQKEINLTPEEIIRQLYLQVLLQHYHYPAKRIEVEYAVSFGVEKKRADIAIMDKDRPETPYIIIELKKPKLKDGKDQLKSYCNATGAPIGVWTNGEQISYYHRKDPNYFEDINHIPHANEKLSDVLTERWTIADLIKNDKLLNEKKSLKDLILEMEDEVLANAGVDVFEELFKLIFTKLYDEMEGGRNPQRHLEFRNNGDTEFELKTKIQSLFEKASKRWEDVFAENSKIELTLSHLSICIAALQNVKLFNSNLEVVDEAFEYLINKTSKGEKGQYFTPRYVIDMCIKMLNPKEKETMIDTAAGSCGFPVHTIFYVWKQILKEEGIAQKEGITQSYLFTSEKKPTRWEDYVKEKIFAIDFDEKAVRVGRTLNLIAGDGQTNVLHLNTLDYDRWHERINEDETWRDTYDGGWKRLKRLRTKNNDNGGFEFDILMANPPFAGDIKESRMLAKYDLGKKPDGKRQSAVGRDILFIERNLDFLKEGGRMAVVLPQGRFNNSSDKAIREFISERCRILAIVGLHGNVFKPHTGTKTSVLFVQKWTDNNGICPRKADYPIFFATMQKPSKDNGGDKIYMKQQDGEPLLDEHGHLIVDHDLFNHEGLTQDGIAEAFIEFAKKEKLSFFDCDLLGFKNLTGLYAEPFNQMKYQSLLDRLEVSEVMFCKTLENKDFRIDSDFYTKAPKVNASLRYVPIGDILLISQYGISIEMNEGSQGYRIYRMNEIHNMLCDLDVNKYADILFSEFQKFQLKDRDVLFNRTNSYEWVGRTGIFYEQENKDFIFASYLVRFVPNQEFVLPEYLTTFLNTKFGIWDIKRRARHSINQTNVNPEEVKAIQIPLFSIEFQNKIKDCFDKAHKNRASSQTIYSAAENLLLEELGLKDFKSSQQNINIKSFKDSFLSSGRLDAEYYQPKYEEIENKIKSYLPSRSHAENGNNNNKNNGLGCKHLGEIVSIQKSVETGSDAYSDNGIPYVRVSNLTKFGLSMPDICISNDYYQKNKKVLDGLKLKKDTILLSKDGSVGIAYKVTEHLEMITSGALLHLTLKNPDQILPDCLTLILNSDIVQKQAERDAGGSIIVHWRVSEIESVLIPMLPIEIQTQIADLVKQSFALKSESEKLLETAKRAIEIAIETNEQTAMDYINSKIEKGLE
jgi:type I restriction enzyme M protein